MTDHIEALIFASEQPLTLVEIKECLSKAFETDFQESFLLEQIATITDKYSKEGSVLQLQEEANGYRFVTKKDYHDTVKELVQLKDRKRLSTAAMETLSIIAYKQPITKTDIEHIRGVNSDYSIQKLLEKELIEIAGRSEEPGRPLLYATGRAFMEHFGLKSMKDLPQLKDIKVADNEIGEAQA